MSNRLFQGVIHQMKDAIDRVIGVLDENGAIISCSELVKIGETRPGVREALRARFPRAKNTAQTRGAVQSLVVEVLERKLAAEVITGYDAVEVTALADEPGICLVTFGFTVTHGMDQIWLSAEVTV